MLYQVERLEFQTVADTVFDEREIAIDEAKMRSWDDGVWAVLELQNLDDDSESEVSALVYQRQVFERRAS